MEIIETVPIYSLETWSWLIPLLLCLWFLIITISASEQNNKKAMICCLIITFILFAFILVNVGENLITKYDHDEYIVKLTDISAKDFTSQYKVTKTFDYSDCIQVKKLK